MEKFIDRGALNDDPFKENYFVIFWKKMKDSDSFKYEAR